ncbi:potassium-transporting ATPase subunit KdpA [Dactylosporangium aurantiacum]|uniref:Potassium-transporting ATPase potassium-binding subunit n=1 Tax=Dactylosporangium aurantiacum TaxID=35754 RepID=A0A9Q9MG84_9ACTN|nr:potassium-transporting ATPase subunit KdpA [Dactylosporangium aurantiacum]MDG6110105.1 potassium-transporting ATPase subunit KdpA [Dactylosporangium aurantiacum]UWZ51356.1 potassium-transporting ATPase subunit KdpA [Dactylosporangium aurantiacum]
MSTTTAGVGFVASLILALVLVYRPFGDYMYRAVTPDRHTRAERLLYRAVGVNPDGEQSWGVYARSVLAFSAISILALYLFQRVQNHLWLSLGFDPVKPDQAWNTAVSFVTNTNWQSYSGESTMGHLVQMAGLAVQNFASAAVGIAVAVALVRGFARAKTDQLGNFWVDLVRICVRILLPIAVIGATIFIAGGMVQNLSGGTDVTTLAGATQSITGGPVASQEVIKELGTNGGGFYNANSSHPFENPTGWTNWIELFLILCIPFSLPRVFGRMVGDRRQGLAIAGIMAILAIGSIIAINAFQLSHGGTVPTAVGAATEGTETRFGVSQSATFASITTLTSTGAVNSFHDSYTSLGGMVTMLNMMLGEVAPGGVGSGLYGMLILAVITVFVAGLMVGRTPEYLGKKIGAREIKFASLYLLTTPALVLVGTAVAMGSETARASMANPGAHGLSEVLYAFTSASNNNGSAFAGIGVNTTFYNTALGLCMLLGRLLPIILVLGLAGSLARQTPVPESSGTLRTYQPLFIGMVIAVTVIVVLLTYLPALALGPLAEGI